MFETLWYTNSRKGWRFWYGFAPPLGKREPAASHLRWMAALLLLPVIIHDKLTCLRLYDILIAGRDDALVRLRPSTCENGTCRQPIAMDGGFTFTSCGCSCCDRDRSQPAQSRWSCRTMKSFQSLTRHHPLRFCRASEVKSQAPSYSFLPLGALKGSFKGSSRIITYVGRCVNFQFYNKRW